MSYHWLRNPKVIIFTPLILLLLFTVACDGTAAEPIVVEKEVVREVVKEVVVEKEVPIEVIKEVVVEKEVIRDVVKEVVVVATPIPVGAVSIAPDKFKLNRLIVAVAPLGFDSNYSYKTSSSGLLDKRLASEWLIDIDRNTGEYIPNLADSWEMAPNGK
jgi:ABC-type transport system substrate-binding protein